jgi:NifU-like protein involved in Fe-S cluster formation
MTIWLKVVEETIEEASFQTYGCPAPVACGSMTTSLVTGRKVNEAKRLTKDDLILMLG